METNIIAPKEWLREIDVEIEPEKLKSKTDGLLEDYKDKAEVPGFRKGRVPRYILKRRLGSALESAAVEEIIEQVSKEILEEHKLKPAAQAKITDLEVTPDKAIRFHMKLEVLPEFDLKDYEELKLKKHEPAGFDQEFEKRLRALQDKCATFKSVSRPAREHDYLTVNYRTFNNGKEISKPKINVMLDVGDKMNFEEVNRTLTGVRPGDERSAEVEVAPDNPEKEIAGRKITFKFTVLEVKEKTVPEINEEFALDLGYDSMDALRQDVNEQILADRAQLVENELKNQIFDYLTREHDFEPPQSWVNANVERMRREYKLSDNEETHKRLLPGAVKRAKFDIIAARIAEKEKIEVTEEEIRQQIETLAENAKRPASELAPLLDNPAYRTEMLREKVIKFILNKADVN
ncbi:trigger factor [candidate division WOR-3 bacterium JGI_Cruoil_03_51_56]|uniref:Trigger factor n=1 Tax=candidate division WOR-3 bacterium JGI_Cruoil_03_51_56 TaxID=1973747 RepID=A0A235BUT8_UNCW3|nr:MAG: trigger factor [candidate division WOR-3 bacterium JGI_Cruoil_03_51_56]OYD16826.1 MAG: trigger factor [candidate division WOR-3 bacterium JGI_Cruoil_03_51_56]